MNQNDKIIGRVINNNMTEHSNLLTTIIYHKGSAFLSQVIKKIANVIGITLEHALTKHAQRIGMLEITHASLKKWLNFKTDERRSMWYKFVNIAVLNYNAFYHTNNGCEPSRVFHGRVSYNVLDLKMGIRPQKPSMPNSQFSQDVLEPTDMILQDAGKNAMQANNKYKVYHDQKANASKLA